MSLKGAFPMITCYWPGLGVWFGAQSSELSCILLVYETLELTNMLSPSSQRSSQKERKKPDPAMGLASEKREMVKLVCHLWPPSPRPVSVPKHLALLGPPISPGCRDFRFLGHTYLYCITVPTPAPLSLRAEHACFPAPAGAGAPLLAPQGGVGPERAAPRRGDSQKEASCLIPNHFSKNKNDVQMNISIFISNSRFQLQY